MIATRLFQWRVWRALAIHLRERMRLLFTVAEPAPQDYPFTQTELAELLRVTGSDRGAELDEPTWRDLLLARYLDVLGPEVSIFGRQLLYRRLRAGVDGDAAGAQRERIGALLADPAALDALHERLRALRHGDVEVAELLFEREAPPRPDWVGRLPLVPLALGLSLAAALLWSPLAWLGTGTVVYLLISVQMGYGERIGEWRRSLLALQMMLRVVSQLDGSGLPLTEAFGARGAQAGRLNRGLARAPVAGQLPGAREYADWFLLANVRHYFRTIGLVFGQRDFLRECHWLCAELEADAALARHLRAQPAWCWAERAAARRLHIDAGVHPLLTHANPLSLSVDGKGVFLSGQNGVGKSTFLRMLGLNLAAARAFGFCYARSAALPALPVIASMQNEDALLDGQSLYIAELARARELLTAAAARPVVCLVDEVFRGTNHDEAVSAGAAVVEALSQHALVLVSSHNLVLGGVLAHRLAPWRVERAPDGGLRLEPGVLGRTNGVALLAAHGFDAAVQSQAERIALWLAGQRQAAAGAGAGA